MENTEQHTMQLELTHPSGVEEWACPTCERRFVVQWPPKYKKIILEVGNEYAAHSGGKGELMALSLGVDRLQVDELNPGDLQEEPWLSDEWHTFLNDLDFGDWPDISDKPE